MIMFRLFTPSCHYLTAYFNRKNRVKKKVLTMEQVFDVAIIGGGINGCGCAADADRKSVV